MGIRLAACPSFKNSLRPYARGGRGRREEWQRWRRSRLHLRCVQDCSLCPPILLPRRAGGPFHHPGHLLAPALRQVPAHKTRPGAGADAPVLQAQHPAGATGSVGKQAWAVAERDGDILCQQKKWRRTQELEEEVVETAEFRVKSNWPKKSVCDTEKCQSIVVKCVPNCTHKNKVRLYV